MYSYWSSRSSNEQPSIAQKRKIQAMTKQLPVQVPDAYYYEYC